MVHPSVEVALPPLRVGAAMLAHMRVRHVPAGADPLAASYRSVAPCRFVLRDALVHSSCGIVAIGETLIADTLDHTAPAPDCYRRDPGGIVLLPRGRTKRLRGTHLALLAGGTGNYWHWTIECLARLAVAGDGPWQSVLVPGDAPGFQAQGLDLALPDLPRRAVGTGETLRVERLAVPWTVVGQHAPHPCLVPFFRAMAAQVTPGETPRRVYVDRRGSTQRRLLNEDALVAVLAGYGFQPVRLETLCVAAQIRLFAGAEAIVAPHGAGLANLAFARPGCQMLELFMDDWVNWTMRRLAAVAGVGYDCVFGRALPTGPQVPGYQDWEIPLTHVMAAVAAMPGGGGIRS